MKCIQCSKSNPSVQPVACIRDDGREDVINLCSRCLNKRLEGVEEAMEREEEVQLNVKIKKKYKKWLDRRAFEDEKDIKTIVDKMLEEFKDLGKRFTDDYMHVTTSEKLEKAEADINE